MKKKIRVLIVDDHAMMRVGLAETIRSEADMTLAGEAVNGKQAVEMYQRHHPDVVVMDYQMPEVNGVEATVRLRAQFPGARVILLSIFEGEEDIWRAAEAGVMGYVPKSVEVDDVLSAIRHVAAGDTYFPPAIVARLETRRARSSLTPRELDVLRLIVAGQSNKEIVSSLNISDATVKLHVSNLLAKLGVHDRTQAAIQAVQRGLIHLET